MHPKETTSEITTYDLLRAHTQHKDYAQHALPKKPGFVSYHPSFQPKILGPSPKLTLVERRKEKFAHEAGVYIKSTNKNYFTSNYQSGKSVHLYAVDCESHEIEKLDYPNVVLANGACNWKDKVLYCAQGDFTRPSMLVAIDPKSGSGGPVVRSFYGREFNSVNDVVIHHARDEIWFTDPTYGYEQAFRPSPLLPSQVYRFDPKIGQIWCVADGFAQCNGLCFSPDYKKMYITDTGAIQAYGGPGNGHNVSFNPRLPATIYEYDVVDDGTRLANRRMFAFADAGVPDGIKCDEAGNVYSGCGDGVHVWDSAGTLLGKIYTGTTVANFNFAKKGMWLMAEEELFYCEIEAKGCLYGVECA